MFSRGEKNKNPVKLVALTTWGGRIKKSMAMQDFCYVKMATDLPD